MARNKKPSYAEILKSNAANAGRWLTRARDMLGDYIGQAVGGQAAQERNRFIRYFNSQAGRAATGMGASDATDKMRGVIQGRAGQLKPERVPPNSLQDQHIGGMYAFVYKAKHAKDLPYWDAFPLIFLINNQATVGGKMSNQHYLGINLHYISPRQRAFLMDAINDRLLRNGFDELHPEYNPRLYTRITYQVLSQAARNRLFAPCVKMYRKDHVIGGNLVKIPGANWAEVMFLPTARWRINNNNPRFKDRAKNQSGIWRESARR